MPIYTTNYKLHILKGNIFHSRFVSSPCFICNASQPRYWLTKFTKGLFIWKPGWPAKRDSPVSEILLCSYFYSKNYCAFIWTRLKEARSRLPGWKFLHINTHKQARLVARMKVQRYRRKLFLTTVKTIQCNKIVPASGMKFSHINTRETRLPGCLAKRASLASI